MPLRQLDCLILKNCTVGWICAFGGECVAAQAYLDEKLEGPEFLSLNSNNIHTLAKLANTIFLSRSCPTEYGTSSAASVARDMLHSFPNVGIGLMVGISGGALSPKHDIRLDEIVVSAPRNWKGGVF